MPYDGKLYPYSYSGWKVYNRMTAQTTTIAGLDNTPTALTGAEYIPLSQPVSGTYNSYKATINQILALVPASVSSFTIASANGFAGSVSAGITPIVTLSTTISGILSGNGTAISAASTTGSGSVVLATSPVVTGISSNTYTSTVATGTAPFTVASTTQVANLYSSRSALADAVTNAIFTTALTVNGGTLTLTANAANTSVLTIGAGASSITGANTGDQTITLTGAVTGSGTGSFATTIATPGTLTVTSTNSTATAHTHAITSSSAPGAAASILATDASGIIGATGTRIVKGWFTDLTVTNAVSGSVTGNAATATALQNARTIGGTSFDGTGNITVATATGGFTVSGGTLRTNTANSSGASNGDIVTANTFGVRGANAANTTTYTMVRMTAADACELGDANNNLYIASAQWGNVRLITLGAADSGGAGFRVLRVPNS